MKKYTLFIIGIVGLIASFICMVFSQSSVGGFLLLAQISGTAIGREIGIVGCKKRPKK